MAVVLHTALHWAMQLPWARRMISRFIWMKPSFPWATASSSGAHRWRSGHARLRVFECPERQASLMGASSGSNEC